MATRRNRYLVFVLAAHTGACAGANLSPDALAAEQRAIVARGEAMLAAENARDFTTSLAMYTADAVILGPGMPVLRGRETLRAMYEQMAASNAPQTKAAFTERHIVVAASGDLAWEESGASTTIETPNGPTVERGKQLMVWRKVDGTWQLAALAWSGDSPPKAPASPPASIP